MSQVAEDRFPESHLKCGFQVMGREGVRPGGGGCWKSHQQGWPPCSSGDGSLQAKTAYLRTCLLSSDSRTLFGGRHNLPCVSLWDLAAALHRSVCPVRRWPAQRTTWSLVASQMAGSGYGTYGVGEWSGVDTDWSTVS